MPVNPARASQARFVPQTTIETPGSAARAAQDAAATSIQAVFRGWRVRRSEALWWQGCKHAMRGRRVAAREWEQHQMFMRATYGLQEQVSRRRMGFFTHGWVADRVDLQLFLVSATSQPSCDA